MKPRSDSRLFKLSAEQQARLYDWIHKLGYVKAKELAALPPPHGFGLKTHLNSLCRFVTRYSEMQKEREFFDILRCASGELHPQALQAAETMAHQMAYDIASGPQQDLDTFRLVSQWIRHFHDKQLGHAWTKIEYDRLALHDKLATLRAARDASAQLDRRADGGSNSNCVQQSARESPSVVKDSPSAEKSAVRTPQYQPPYLQAKKFCQSLRTLKSTFSDVST